MHKGTRNNRLDLGDVEDWVYLERSGELETNCDRIDDLGNLERSNEAWREFLTGTRDGKMFGPKHDLLTRKVLGSWNTMAISLMDASCAGTEESGAGTPPDASAAAHMGLGPRSSHLYFLVREQRRLVAQGSLERRDTRRGADESVVCVLDPGKMLAPGGGVLGAVAPEGIFQGLVGPLSLAVGLGVVARGETGLGPYPVTESLPRLGDELRASVRNDVQRDAVEADDMQRQEICHLGSGGEFGERDVMDCLRKAVDDRQDRVVSLGGWKAGHEVHRDVGPGTTGDRKGTEMTSRRRMGILAACADPACGDKLFDIGA